MRHQKELLHTTVLGGVKIKVLDRMRVTLKVDLADSSRPPVRHKLDLYNCNQLEKFIRKVAEKHEVGINVIAVTLSELTGELEKYRLDKLKEQQAGPQLMQLTEEEQTHAQENLKAENLQEKQQPTLPPAASLAMRPTP